MQSSDFLTILGLAIAIWSIIPNKERKFILLFFADSELWLFGISWLVVLYLMAFDWLQANWFPWLSVFTVQKGIPANTLGFLVALLAIAYPILKVTFSFFAKQRVNDLITLYKSLIKENEIDLLVGYIEKYHINDIQAYLKGKSNLVENEEEEFYSRRRRTAEDKAYAKLLKPKRITFAAYVYGNILQNELFIKAAANKYPELFAKAFYGMETKRAANQDVVKLYIEQLFENKNQSLIQELKIVNGSSTSIKDRDEYYDLPILSGLLVHTKAASENNVWYPVGEGAVKSLKYDKEQKAFLEKEYDDDLEPELWSCKVYIAMVYFNYMVRETIYRDSEWHMWLFYFRHFTDHIIENIPEENSYEMDRERPSFNHYLIYKMFDIMIGWIELDKELETDHRIIDTIRCLGWCIHSLCQADERKISLSFKKRHLERLVDMYYEYAYHPDNVAANTAREWLLKLFLNPKGVDFGVPEITTEYLWVMEQTWDAFDKVPFTYHGNGYILEEFKNNILQPLGINIQS
jgi:hypothetical protein